MHSRNHYPLRKLYLVLCKVAARPSQVTCKHDDYPPLENGMVPFLAKMRLALVKIYHRLSLPIACVLVERNQRSKHLPSSLGTDIRCFHVAKVDWSSWSPPGALWYSELFALCTPRRLHVAVSQRVTKQTSTWIFHHSGWILLKYHYQTSTK